VSANEMTTTFSRRRPAARLIWAAVLIVGAVGWLAYVLAGDADRAWRALLINFVYFTPLAAGLAVWPAVVTASRGRWMGQLQSTAAAGVGFAPASMLAFVILFLGRNHWAGWLCQSDLANNWWLNEPFLFLRDAVALAVIWLLAWLFGRQSRQSRQTKMAGWLILTYAVVFTLIAFDMVMALDPHWFSTLFGGYFFVSGMYAAAAAWTLMSLRSQPGPDVRQKHDLGKLIVALSLLTAYMMFSQLIVLWYENLPHEVRFVIPRLSHGPWRLVSAALLATIYLGPLVYLLSRWSKLNARPLGIAAAAVLIGLWMERWWLVTPTLGGELTIGGVEVCITAAFVAAWVLSMGAYRSRESATISESGGAV
jgi:hypothetical protein